MLENDNRSFDFDLDTKVNSKANNIFREAQIFQLSIDQGDIFYLIFTIVRAFSQVVSKLFRSDFYHKV